MLSIHEQIVYKDLAYLLEDTETINDVRFYNYMGSTGLHPNDIKTVVERLIDRGLVILQMDENLRLPTPVEIVRNRCIQSET